MDEENIPDFFKAMNEFDHAQPRSSADYFMAKVEACGTQKELDSLIAGLKGEENEAAYLDEFLRIDKMVEEGNRAIDDLLGSDTVYPGTAERVAFLWDYARLTKNQGLLDKLNKKKNQTA